MPCFLRQIRMADEPHQMVLRRIIDATKRATHLEKSNGISGERHFVTVGEAASWLAATRMDISPI